MSIFVKEIIHLEHYENGTVFFMKDMTQTVNLPSEWVNRYRPKEGDYLTHNSDGYYSVIPKHAFEAIRQVYLV